MPKDDLEATDGVGDDVAVPGSGGIDRRTLIRRGAKAGVAAVWAVPLVQTVDMTAAYAQVGSPSVTCTCVVEVYLVTPGGTLGPCLGEYDLTPASCACLTGPCGCDPVGTGCTCDYGAIDISTYRPCA